MAHCALLHARFYSCGPILLVGMGISHHTSCPLFPMFICRVTTELCCIVHKGMRQLSGLPEACFPPLTHNIFAVLGGAHHRGASCSKPRVSGQKTCVCCMFVHCQHNAVVTSMCYHKTNKQSLENQLKKRY